MAYNQQQNNDPSKKSQFDGLAQEVDKIIKDKEFQKTLDKFTLKHEPLFKFLKGFGFFIAMLSGMFGYFLKANSEADDRRAEMIHKVISEKKEYYKKISDAIIELRKTIYLIKYDCEHKKPPSPEDQALKRTLARYNFIASFVGIGEVYDAQTREACRELVRFDEGIADICAKDAPDEDKWREFFAKITAQIEVSIKKDRDTLEILGKGILSSLFKDI